MYCVVIKDPVSLSIIQRIAVPNEFIFLSIYFYHNITLPRKNTILLICISAFLLFCVVDYLYFGTKGINLAFGPLAIECLFFLLVILYYFYQRMKFVALIPIYKLSSFWISVAFLIYFSGTFLLFLASISMVHDDNFSIQYNVLYGTVAILKNLLIVVGLFVHRFSKKDDLFETIQPGIDLDSFQPFDHNTNLPNRKWLFYKHRPIPPPPALRL